MLKKAAGLACLATLFAGSALAQEGPVPKGVGHLDHVFVIMMENHGYQQIINNPNEPYLNSLIANKKIRCAQQQLAGLGQQILLSPQ